MSNASTIKIDIKVDDSAGSASLRKFGTNLDAAGKKGQSAGNAISASWKGMAAVIGGVSMVALGREIISVADNYTNLESRLKLVTGSSEELVRVQASLLQSANEGRSSYETTADLYTRLSRATRELGTTEQERIALTDSINKAMIVSGASTENAKAGIMQMTQALQGGVVRAEEYNSMMENTPRILEAVAAGWANGGITLGELRQKMLDGELTSKAFLEAFKNGASGIEKEFSQMKVTVTQALTVLDNAYKDIIDSANDSSGATDGVATAVLDLAEVITENKDGILSLLTEMIGLAGSTVEAFGNIGRSIQGLRAVAAGELSFFEYATSNAEELNQALKENASGVGALNAKLDELRQKKDEAGRYWVFTAEQKKAQRDELDAVNEQIAATEKQIEALKQKGQASTAAASVSLNAAEAEYLAVKKTGAATAEDVETTKGAANEKARIAERLADDRKRLEEDVTDALAKEGMTQTEQAAYELKKQYDEDMKIAGDDVKLQQMVTEAYQNELKKRTKADNDWAAHSARQHLAAAEKIKDGWQVAAEGREEADRIANERIEEQNTETASVITEEWGRAMDSIQSYTVDLVMGAEFSFDTILDIFKRMLAEMLVAIFASGIKEAFLSIWGTGSFSGAGSAFMRGMSGSLGGGVGASGFTGAGATGWTNPDGSGWGGKALGGLAVAGGAYGMYSGAQNIKKGNVGTGALQLGLGGLSAYQGAVMLGIVEKGAFTAGMNALGAKIGLTVAPKVAATVAASVGAPSASLAAAESAYLAGSAPAAPALSAAPAAAATGTPALATAAAYAVPALAAFLVGKGIFDKANRPSASAEIDQYGVTPDNIREFNDQFRSMDGSILQSVPTLQKYSQAMYDTETQVLTLQNGTKELQLQFDAAAQAGHQWSSDITGGTSILTSSAAQIIDSFSPMPLTVQMVAEATDLASNAFYDLANGSENATRTTNKLNTYLEDLGMTEQDAAAAAQQLMDNVAEMGNATVTAAGAIAGSAGQIQAAYRAIESQSYENSNGSDYSSHIVPPSSGDYPDIQYHAAGGIFTRPTRIGRDVFGENGMEALMPLHNGPKTLPKMDGKLDTLIANSRRTQVFHTHVYVDGKEVATAVKKITADQASRGFARLSA